MNDTRRYWFCKNCAAKKMLRNDTIRKAGSIQLPNEKSNQDGLHLRSLKNKPEWIKLPKQRKRMYWL